MRVRKKISICRYKGGFDDKLYTPREFDSRASKREIKKILHHKEKTLPAHINKQVSILHLHYLYYHITTNIFLFDNISPLTVVIN